MYTTRRFHPKTVESYLSIGDPYDKARLKEDRFKGKQFQTNPPKEGQLVGYFTEFKYATDSYQDQNGYRVTQPRANRKLGFGSLDARRRDEFTLEIRAQQYKELLDRENYFHGRYSEEQKNRDIDREGGRASTAPAYYDTGAVYEDDPRYPYLFQTQVPNLLYDIGKDGGTTPICNKCSRETFYCKHRVGNGSVTLRRTGPLKTASQIIGHQVNHAPKPVFGRKSSIKDFYDSNHLSVMQH